MLKFIEGKKTYLVAAGSLLYAALGVYVQHTLTPAEGLQLAQAAVMGAFIRHGVKTGA